MTSGVRPDSKDVIKQAYPTTVGGLATLDYPGMIARGLGYDAHNGKYDRDENGKGQGEKK